MLRVLAFIAALVLSPQLLAGTPDFRLNDLDGKAHSLSDYRGKWVVVNYWATWCPPCLDELPELARFHEEHKDTNGLVLGVNYEELDEERLKRFVDEYFIPYPILRGSPEMSTLGPVRGLPTTYLIAPDGRIVARKSGPVTADGIRQFIEMFEATASSD